MNHRSSSPSMAWALSGMLGLLCMDAAIARTPDAAPAAAPAWQQVKTQGLPHARHENSMAAIGDRLYLLGGRGDRPLDIFDLKTRRWSQGSAPPQAVSHAQVATLDGLLYVVGGLLGDYPEEATLANVLIYDPAQDRWSVGAEIPAARRRGAAGTVAHDGLLYLVGGNTRGHMSGYVPWLDAFDPRSGRWTVLPDAPRPRDHLHAAVIDGRIYAGGGRKSAHESGDTLAQTVAEVDVYDIAAGTWSTLPAPLPTPRAGAATVVRNGSLVLIGGESNRQVPAHAEVEAWDPASARWRSLAPLPVGRHGTQAAVVDGDLYIAAGSGNRGGGPELNDLLMLPRAD